MATQLTADHAKESLNAHVASKGCDLFAKYGVVGYQGLQAVLQDRACVRYPCEIAFDSTLLNPGEFAHAEQQGARPEDGFTIWVHPFFLLQLEKVPYLVYYHLVVVNYGVFASPDDAETFGAAALGLMREEYYEALCALADQISGEPGHASDAGPGSGSSLGGCDGFMPHGSGCRA